MTALVKSEPKNATTPSRSHAAAMLDITEKENALKSAAGFGSFAAEAKRRCKEEEQPTPPFSLLSEIANDCRSSVVETAIETVGCEKETSAAGVQRLKVKEEKGEVMTLVMVGADSVDAATQFFSSSSSLSSSSSSSSSTRSSIDSDSALSQVGFFLIFFIPSVKLPGTLPIYLGYIRLLIMREELNLILRGTVPVRYQYQVTTTVHT